MSFFSKDAAEKLFIGVVCSILTFLLPKIFTSNDLELEYAPLLKERFINIPSLLNGQVQILVDGKPQSNLSVLDVYLFNRSHKDLKNIPLTFEFFSQGGGEVPELLGKNLSKPDSFPKDSITEIPLGDPNQVRYKITSMPTVNNTKTEFVASFVFLGDVLPSMKVQSDYADEKVLAINKYDSEKAAKKQLFEIFLGVMLFTILFVGVLYFDSKRSQKRFEEKLGAAAEKYPSNNISKEVLRDIAISSWKQVSNRTKSK